MKFVSDRVTDKCFVKIYFSGSLAFEMRKSLRKTRSDKYSQIQYIVLVNIEIKIYQRVK